MTAATGTASDFGADGFAPTPAWLIRRIPRGDGGLCDGCSGSARRGPQSRTRWPGALRRVCGPVTLGVRALRHRSTPTSLFGPSVRPPARNRGAQV